MSIRKSPEFRELLKQYGTFAPVLDGLAKYYDRKFDTTQMQRMHDSFRVNLVKFAPEYNLTDDQVRHILNQLIKISEQNHMDRSLMEHSVEDRADEALNMGRAREAEIKQVQDTKIQKLQGIVNTTSLPSVAMFHFVSNVLLFAVKGFIGGKYLTIALDRFQLNGFPKSSLDLIRQEMRSETRAQGQPLSVPNESFNIPTMYFDKFKDGSRLASVKRALNNILQGHVFGLSYVSNKNPNDLGNICRDIGGTECRLFPIDQTKKQLQKFGYSCTALAASIVGDITNGSALRTIISKHSVRHGRPVGVITVSLDSKYSAALVDMTRDEYLYFSDHMIHRITYTQLVKIAQSEDASMILVYKNC